MVRLNAFRTAGAAAALLAALAVPAAAKDFYEGRTITIIVGFGPGGGYDTMARLLSRHMGNHIPGSPAIIVQNMPGSSGLKSVNHLYAAAPRDGTVFGTFHSATPLHEALGAKGIRFKSAELSWVGTMSQSVNVIAVTKAAGVETVEDVRKKEVIMGAVGSGGGIMGAYPRLLNNFFDTKFRIVAGYRGSNGVFLAMERNEVHGATTAWASWNIARPQWVKEGKIVPLMQIGPKKLPDLPNVPLLYDLVKNDEQRQMVNLLSGNMQIERPFAGPPKIPDDRLETLRRAFDGTVKDPKFLAEAKRLGAKIDPHTGEEAAKIVKSIIDTPLALVAKLRSATGLK